MFYKSAFALALFAAAGFVHAQALSLEEIKARNGALLSAEELQKLIPGAKVINHVPNGSTRLWTNNPNGSLVVSSDSRGRSATGGTRPHSAEGSWRIENGAYCVTMTWLMAEERWCRHLYRIGDRYYGVPVRAEQNENARAMEFEFSK